MAFVISRTSPIGELVLNHPVAAAVLLGHGFHCIGCSLSAYETIEEGAVVHGMDDAAIDALVSELQDAVKGEAETLRKATTAKPSAAPLPKEKKGKKSEKG
jgi:hybrid cluster-associated redox disulfide protein